MNEGGREGMNEGSRERGRRRAQMSLEIQVLGFHKFFCVPFDFKGNKNKMRGQTPALPFQGLGECVHLVDWPPLRIL